MHGTSYVLQWSMAMVISDDYEKGSARGDVIDPKLVEDVMIERKRNQQLKAT